jgi:hypothetical protein
VAFPVTPLLLARARFCISASHTREDLTKALDVSVIYFFFGSLRKCFVLFVGTYINRAELTCFLSVQPPYITRLSAELVTSWASSTSLHNDQRLLKLVTAIEAVERNEP